MKDCEERKLSDTGHEAKDQKHETFEEKPNDFEEMKNCDALNISRREVSKQDEGQFFVLGSFSLKSVNFIETGLR